MSIVYADRSQSSFGGLHFTRSSLLVGPLTGTRMGRLVMVDDYRGFVGGGRSMKVTMHRDWLYGFAD
jgi:hypothetical protein